MTSNSRLALPLAAAFALAPLGAIAETYNEAPELAERVAAGELPPVEERLPETPMVVEPLEMIGQYGGTWNAALTGSGDRVWITRTVGYENLMRWDPEWTTTIPNVAERVEADAEGRVFTFHLRRGMKWSDGDDFTAEDVVFAWNDVIAHPDLGSIPSFMMTGEAAPVVEMIDEVTVTMSFGEPKGLLLSHLAHGNADWFTRFPKHYLSQFHIDYNPEVNELAAAEGVGNWIDLFNIRAGDVQPSMNWRNAEIPTLNAWRQVTPYDGSTGVVVFERNPYYWKVDPEGNQLPYINDVRFQVTQDREVTLLKAIAGELDFQWRRINAESQRPVLVENQERGGYNFHARIPANMNTAIFFLNLTHKDMAKRELYQNRDFRIALSHAIDRQEIIDTIFVGLGEPYQAAPRPDSPYFDEAFATQFTEHDVDRANELLDAIGLTERNGAGTRLRPDGQPVIIVLEMAAGKQFIDMGPLLERQLERVGVDLEVRVIERSLFETRLEGNDLDAGMWEGDGGRGVELDPRWYFPANWESGFAPAWADYYTGGPDAETPSPAALRQQELFDEVSRTVDEAQREELMRELLQIAKEEFWAIGISLPLPAFGVSNRYLYNVPTAFPGSFAYPDPAPTNPHQYFYGDEARDRAPG